MWNFLSGCGNRASWMFHAFVSPSEKSKREVLGGGVQMLQQDPGVTSSRSSSLDERVHVLAEGIKNGKFQNIVVLTGAGISCAAGIPDFRSRTGMYERSTKFSLPSAWSVFEYGYFKSNPVPFYDIVQRMMFDTEVDRDSWQPQQPSGAGLVQIKTATTGEWALAPPKSYRPTLTHCFFTLLEKKNMLRRVITQNVDCLDRVSGLSKSKLCQMHGSMEVAKCIHCNTKVGLKECADQLQPRRRPQQSSATRTAGGGVDTTTTHGGYEGGIPKTPKRMAEGAGGGGSSYDTLREKYTWREDDGWEWSVPLCPKCCPKTQQGTTTSSSSSKVLKNPPPVVKPNVVLFNEGLPAGNLVTALTDLPACDLLLCFGSTFQVMPFATFIGKVDDLCPRVLFNREMVATAGTSEGPLADSSRFRFTAKDNFRDLFLPGDCDDTVKLLCDELGWTEDLLALHHQAGEVSLDSLDALSKKK